MMQRIAVLACGLLLFAAAGVSAQSRGDVGGTVAYVDPVAKTITFTDGRIVQLEPNSKIFVNGREMPLAELQPGVVITTPVVGNAAPTVTAIGGTVASVDPVAKTIRFTDGRIVQLDPRSRIFINGREVTFGEVRPGVVVTMNSPAPSTSVTVVPGPTQQTAVALPRSPSPVDVSGTIASFDRQTGIITLQDGRMVRLSNDGGTAWQLVRSDTLRPGSQVFLSRAIPVGFRAAGAAPSWNDPNLAMGRVVNVDPGGSQILLSDGTVVRVNPSTSMQAVGGQNVTITELSPGDQVVMHMRQPASVAVVPTPSSYPGAVASPWPGYRAIIDADQVVVIRYPEAR
jgi:hypothetical protein